MDHKKEPTQFSIEKDESTIEAKLYQNFIDMKIVFMGIIFSKTNFKNKYMVKTISKTIVPEIFLNNYCIEDDSENSEENKTVKNKNFFFDENNYLDNKYKKIEINI